MKGIVTQKSGRATLTPSCIPSGISYSPQVRLHQETKMAVCQAQRSTSTISRKIKGLWTVYKSSSHVNVVPNKWNDTAIRCHCLRYFNFSYTQTFWIPGLLDTWTLKRCPFKWTWPPSTGHYTVPPPPSLNEGLHFLDHSTPSYLVFSSTLFPGSLISVRWETLGTRLSSLLDYILFPYITKHADVSVNFGIPSLGNPYIHTWLVYSNSFSINNFEN